MGIVNTLVCALLVFGLAGPSQGPRCPDLEADKSPVLLDVSNVASGAVFPRGRALLVRVYTNGDIVFEKYPPTNYHGYGTPPDPYEPACHAGRLTPEQLERLERLANAEAVWTAGHVYEGSYTSYDTALVTTICSEPLI